MYASSARVQADFGGAAGRETAAPGARTVVVASRIAVKDRIPSRVSVATAIRLPLRPSGHLKWNSFTSARPRVLPRKPSAEAVALRPMSFLAWSAEAESVAAAANFYDWESAEQVTTAPEKATISCLTIARPSDSIIENPACVFS